MSNFENEPPKLSEGLAWIATVIIPIVVQVLTQQWVITIVSFIVLLLASLMFHSIRHIYDFSSILYKLQESISVAAENKCNAKCSQDLIPRVEETNENVKVVKSNILVKDDIVDMIELNKNNVISYVIIIYTNTTKLFELILKGREVDKTKLMINYLNTEDKVINIRPYYSSVKPNAVEFQMELNVKPGVNICEIQFVHESSDYDTIELEGIVECGNNIYIKEKKIIANKKG